MKKIIICAATLVLVAAMCMQVSAYNVDDYMRLNLYENNFDSANPFDGMMLVQQQDVYNFAEKIDETHGNSLVMRYDGLAEATPISSPPRVDATIGKYVLEADFYFGTSHSRNIFLIRTVPIGTSSAYWLYPISVTTGGVLQYQNGPSSNDKANLGVTVGWEEWHNYRVVIDLDNITYSVYIDGEEKLQSFTLPMGATTLQYVNLTAGNSSTAQNPAMTGVDNLRQYFLGAPKVKETVTFFDADGATAAADSFSYESGSKIKIEFSEAINELTLGNISLKDEDGNSAAFTGTYVGAEKIYTVRPSGTLKTNTTYYLNLSGVKSAEGADMYGSGVIVFRTLTAHFGIADFSVDGLNSITEATPGSTVTLRVTVRNRKQENRTATLAAGIYDANSLFSFYTAVVSGVNPEKEYTLTLTVPEGVEEHHLEIYLLNGPADQNVIHMITN